MNKYLLIALLNFFSRWLFYRLPLAVLYVVYLLTYLTLLIIAAPITFTLGYFNIDINAFYRMNDSIMAWFKTKLNLK